MLPLLLTFETFHFLRLLMRTIVSCEGGNISNMIKIWSSALHWQSDKQTTLMGIEMLYRFAINCYRIGKTSCLQNRPINLTLAHSISTYFAVRLAQPRRHLFRNREPSIRPHKNWRIIVEGFTPASLVMRTNSSKASFGIPPKEINLYYHYNIGNY
jgi:hypothetical protein